VLFVILADTQHAEQKGSRPVALASAPHSEGLEVLAKAFYSPGEVASIASVSSSTILNYIHEGRLPAVRLSERTYRIPRKAVIRLLGLEAPEPRRLDDPSGSVDF